MTASRPLRVLIVSTRYLGDCLLAASLVNPIRERYPDAEVDVLTFHRNCGILEGVPGIRRVIGVEERPKKWRQFLDMSAMWNTYDWAIITQQSTRTILYGYFAARRQVVYASANDHRGWWKQKLVTHKVHPYPGHWLDQAEALLEPVLGGRYHIDPSCPDAELPEVFRIRGAYAVFQVCSRYEDKEWSTTGWRALCEKLNARGLRVVIVGGGSSAELERIGRVTEGFAEANVCVCGRREALLWSDRPSDPRRSGVRRRGYGHVPRGGRNGSPSYRAFRPDERHCLGPFAQGRTPRRLCVRPGPTRTGQRYDSSSPRLSRLSRVRPTPLPEERPRHARALHAGLGLAECLGRT